jgi:hypothetical protein
VTCACGRHESTCAASPPTTSTGDEHGDVEGAITKDEWLANR